MADIAVIIAAVRDARQHGDYAIAETPEPSLEDLVSAAHAARCRGDRPLCHVWTAPSMQGLFGVTAPRSGAVMCPASMSGAHDRGP